MKRKCARCGKELVTPAWKYCQECSHNNVLLDMDIVTNRSRVPLAIQEQARLRKRFDELVHEHQELKEQYAQVQYAFELLARHGLEKYMELSHTYPQRITGVEEEYGKIVADRIW